jgi:hypothetical protein
LVGTTPGVNCVSGKAYLAPYDFDPNRVVAPPPPMGKTIT